MGASRVACASFNLGTNTTISITRDNKAYTHTLKYSFNGATGTIVTKTTQTSYVWEPPTSTFYSKIPNSTSGYGTITCETYNGASLVGTTTCGFYAYAVKSACEPTVSGTVVDTNTATTSLTGDSSVIVLYLSKPKCELTATPKNSATIETIQIENPVGLVATTSPYTFDTCYSNEFRFKATDSRGYSKTTKVNASKFIEYEPCYFDKEPIVARTESTSTTATVSLSGYCFNGSFGSVSNTLALKYRYKKSNGTYGSYVNITPTWKTDGTFTASANITNLSVEETYTIEFVVSDKLTSFPLEVVLGQGSGDLRIAKDYIQSKNDFYIGTPENTLFKALRVRRKTSNGNCEAIFGLGATDERGVASMELYKDGQRSGRVEIREDGYLYNYLTGHSLAEIVSSSPSMSTTGGSGYLFLDGGNSTPMLVQWGRISIVPTTANTVATQDVSFIWQFGNVPAVFCEVINGMAVDIQINPTSMTVSGFRANLKRSTVASTAIFWMAIGNGTNALPE